MAYASKREMSSNKTGPLIVVALLHIVLGYALVSGLAIRVVESVREDISTFDVEEEPPPPPEEPPPPPPEQPQTQVPPPVVAPPPIVRTNTTPPPIASQPTAPPPSVTPTAPTAPPAPPAPPPPPPPPRIEPAAPRGDVRTLFSDSDYPRRALRNGEEGTARARLTIGTNGRVSGCTITQSTGSSQLDRATCDVLERRARFQAATDSTGATVQGTYDTPPITWRIQGR
ncbi:energy transducer TonB [Sphingomicrobium sediminis]|uniref:Energy transducer TonB n=1 Tax=Sphingomicrobium sediminis TaxID=2950949 RepID=A0A9X2EJF5_9SPHN|nr:energy transducer TonB [Sphingomicrobium sediminis]MCM8556454.1 energy transducer TonB [Sphingomicrobium sediminis]